MINYQKFIEKKFSLMNKTKETLYINFTNRIIKDNMITNKMIRTWLMMMEIILM